MPDLTTLDFQITFIYLSVSCAFLRAGVSQHACGGVVTTCGPPFSPSTIKDHTQVVRRGGPCLNPLNHLAAFTLCLETGSLTEPELTNATQLGGRQAPGRLPSLSGVGIALCAAHLPSHLGTGEPDSNLVQETLYE